MNLLVVSESFLSGGLEKQIITQKESLSDCKIVYAFENYKENENLLNNKIYLLKPVVTTQDFVNYCEELINIIKTEEIDYIHVHPFYSIFPTIFASQLTNRRMAYSIHGYGSIYFPYRLVDRTLFTYFLNAMNNRIFSVSEHYREVVEASYNRKNISFLPNSLDSEKYTECKYINNGKWILISRLDVDKFNEIKNVIINMESLGIKTIDIVGDGTEREYLEKISEGKNIHFLGYKNDIFSLLKKGYNGVIGIGRVVLEGIFSNLPVLLIGDGRITGLVDYKRFKLIRGHNFVNRFIEDDSIQTIYNKISNIDRDYEDYLLRNKVINDFDSKKIFKNYLSIISDDLISPNYNLIKSYFEIKELKNKEDIFYDSFEVYNILKKYFRSHTVNQNVINFFDQTDFNLSCLSHNNNLRIELLKKGDNLRTELLEKDDNISLELLETNNNLREEIEILSKELEKSIQEQNELKNRLESLDNTKLVKTYKFLANLVKKLK